MNQWKSCSTRVTNVQITLIFQRVVQENGIFMYNTLCRTSIYNPIYDQSTIYSQSTIYDQTITLGSAIIVRGHGRGLRDRDLHHGSGGRGSSVLRCHPFRGCCGGKTLLSRSRGHHSA